MLLRGMVRIDMARRLNAYRVLSLALCSLVLVGWGAFADLRAELAHLKASQDQLLAERTQQQEAVGDLIQLQTKLVSAREELAALADRREQAAAQVAAVQQDRTELTKWLEGRRVKGPPQKGSLSGSLGSDRGSRADSIHQ
jgi:hypothetical protein